MKRALFLCLTCVFLLNARCYADVVSFPPLEPMTDDSLLSGNQMQDPFVKNTYMPSQRVSYPKINDVERSLYGKIYPGQDILIRLARIEKSLFSTTYPNLTLAQRVDNIVANFNQINQYPNISKSGLSKMEARVFGRNYAQNDPQVRVERLEQQILGAVQEGNLEERYQTLQTAASNYNQPSDYYQNPLGVAQGGWKAILGSIGAAMLGGGTLTGFTPSMDPFYNYNTYGNTCNPNANGWFNTGGQGMYNGIRTNRGYSDTFRDYGSSSRVTILD